MLAALHGNFSFHNFVFLFQHLERQKYTHPLGHIGEPIDVAKTIAFLVSDDASFITGQIMFVDGGRHSKPVV